MGSVQDMIKCPQCNGIYMTDFNYRTQEEFRNCSRCGRTERWFIIRDEEGNAVLDKDGRVQMDYELQQGCGSARVFFKNGVGQIWSFSEPIDEETKQAYLEILKKPEVNKEESYLTFWDSQKNEVLAVYGKLPETYDELMEETKET